LLIFQHKAPNYKAPLPQLRADQKAFKNIPVIKEKPINLSMRFPLPTFPIIFTFSLTTATRIFYNNGTLTGWSISPPKPEHKGVVTGVTNLFAVPPTALKTIQTYDPSYTGRYHSEARSMPILKEPLPTTPSLSASKKGLAIRSYPELQSRTIHCRFLRIM